MLIPDIGSLEEVQDIKPDLGPWLATQTSKREVRVHLLYSDQQRPQGHTFLLRKSLVNPISASDLGLPKAMPAPFDGKSERLVSSPILVLVGELERIACR